jgi:hypothetical protein
MKSFEGDTSAGAPSLEALGEVTRAASAPMTPLQRMEGLQAVHARLMARQRRRLPLYALSILGTAAAATGAVLLVRSTVSSGAGAPTTSALAYRIEGGEIGDGGYIRSFNPDGSLLRFGEGTELRLKTGARGRLSSVDARGARFAIEEGEAEVKVTPRPDARWLVDAGPFLITVRGTVFTASWDGATERLDIHMKKGWVSVTGPLADGVMAVRAGQHLSVNMRRKEVLLREPEGEGETNGSQSGFPSATGSLGEGIPENDVSAAPAPTPSAPPAYVPITPSRGLSRVTGAGTRSVHGGAHVAAQTAAQAASARTAANDSPRSWSAALTSGDFDSILDQAMKRGLRRSLVEASSDDLAALADAARYRRRNDIAYRALIAERDRFPQSARGRDSAFFLGRLEEAKADGGARALKWYDLYLREAPSGAYSSEALGRKMAATERLSGIPAARAVAMEYLRRFPNGTYAGAARALRDAP